MKKWILGIVGLAILALAIYAFFPLLYDREVNESVGEIEKRSDTQGGISAQMESATNARELKTGEFEGLGVHTSKGTVRILQTEGKTYLRLEDNFEVTNGPDLFVYFGNNNQYDSAAEIAPLKGNVGGQNYELPENLDSGQYSEVWIWCKQFSVPFAKAELR